MGPLRYQWFKDSKRLTVATSDTPLLVLVDAGVSDSGTYYCQVSNKDGAVCSSKALLNITRIGRVQHAAGALASAAEAGGSSGEQATSPLVGFAAVLRPGGASAQQLCNTSPTCLPAKKLCAVPPLSKTRNMHICITHTT
jgi:Meckel syndrome type 1 protein